MDPRLGTDVMRHEAIRRNVPETSVVVQLSRTTQLHRRTNALRTKGRHMDEGGHMDEDKDEGMDHRAIPSGPVPPAGPDRRQRRRVAPLAAALLGIGFVAAACSSGPSSPGVAGSGSTPTTAASSANAVSSGKVDPSRAGEALAFSRCMRSHGVPNFPDPTAHGQIQIQSGGPGGSNVTSSGLDPNNPHFQAAQTACQHLMPAPSAAEQHQAFSNALRQSQCMRAHGIKDFPDPQSSNGRISMSIRGGAGSDLNPNNPLFQRAQAACMPNAPKPPPGGNSTNGPGNGSSSSGSTFGVGG
jgi:hypothetical protein